MACTPILELVYHFYPKYFYTFCRKIFPECLSHCPGTVTLLLFTRTPALGQSEARDSVRWGPIRGQSVTWHRTFIIPCCTRHSGLDMNLSHSDYFTDGILLRLECEKLTCFWAGATLTTDIMMDNECRAGLDWMYSHSSQWVENLRNFTIFVKIFWSENKSSFHLYHSI